MPWAKIFGTSWKSTQRIIAMALIVCFAFVGVCCLVAWRTVDSVQNDDESPMRLAFSPEVIRAAFDDTKQEHIFRAEMSIFHGEAAARGNNYQRAHLAFADAVDELCDYVGPDAGLTRLVMMRAGTVEQKFHKYRLADNYLIRSLKEPLPASLPKAFPIYASDYLASSYEDQKMWNEAITCRQASVDKARKLKTEDHKRLIHSLMWLAYDNSSISNYSAAIEVNDEVINLLGQKDDAESIENKASAYLSRGFAFLETEQIEKAISDLQTGLALSKKNDDSYFYLGRALQRSGRDSAALDAFNKAIASHRDRYPLEFYRRAQTYSKLAQHEKAIDDFEKTIKFASTKDTVYEVVGNKRTGPESLVLSASEAKDREMQLLAAKRK